MYCLQVIVFLMFLWICSAWKFSQSSCGCFAGAASSKSPAQFRDKGENCGRQSDVDSFCQSSSSPLMIPNSNQDEPVTRESRARTTEVQNKPKVAHSHANFTKNVR